MFQELLKLDISYVVNLKNTKQNTGFFCKLRSTYPLFNCQLLQTLELANFQVIIHFTLTF